MIFALSKYWTGWAFLCRAQLLRVFDLLVFAYREGALTIKDCNLARQQLQKNGEGVPQAFLHSAFEDGILSFVPRLRRGTPADVSTSTCSSLYSSPLHIE